MLGKEYFTITALIGDCITYASKSETAQILFLQNNGAENDGLYARFIRSKLDEQGYWDTAVIAPLWERLIKDKAAAENGARAKAKESLLWRVSDKLGSVLGSHAATNGRCAGCSVNYRDCKLRVLSAGGHFRAGKASLLPEGYHGLIRAASMYENTSSVFSLTDDTLGAKRHELRFGGTVSAAEAARIETWLHYLP